MIGKTVGNFVIASRLGKGGMGEVYLARHKDLDTPVAVKVLNEDISADEDHVKRFFNEARIVGKIRHAGTIKIFDSGVIEGHAYLVMELLEGESLATRLRHGAMPVTRVLDVARQIASVLDATHHAGVVHRDLKPDNIYLISDDERVGRERVKVLDFGIAKLSGTLASGSPKTMGMMGTPGYMAPEQWKDTAHVDWRTDAYALGCVMFEMACGRTPFIAQTIPEAYTKHSFDLPPSPRQMTPAVPVELDALILRLLAKDPAERATSMAEVVRELDEIEKGRAGDPLGVASTVVPVRASAVPPPPLVSPAALTATTLGATAAEVQAARPPARRRVGLAIGALAATVSIIGMVAFVATRSSTSAPPSAPGPAPTQPEPIPAAAPTPSPPAPAIDVPPPATPTPAPPPRPSPPRHVASSPTAHVATPPTAKPAFDAAPLPEHVAPQAVPPPGSGGGGSGSASETDELGGRR